MMRANPYGGPSLRDIRPVHWFIVLGILAATALFELSMGRNAICTCGYVDMWHPALDSGNSQHIADWYTLSHIIHGFLFYGLGWLVIRSRPPGDRLVLAVAIEAAWEMLENSPIIINRYREATIALGYTGDSVINSVADVAWMALGFAFARRVPVWVTVTVGMAFELIALWAIRDNLTLNVVMLAWPIEAIKTWQSAL
ncbi:MAG: DUF2585 domain-containing protein [Sphingobium sp.]|jgi:hypothetical protein|uniref:DUF2585 domain-containing protein n=2 Tax=unclassified Sphingobium TaxID=2611147 RepID=UPI0022EE994D|nr:MULTISPECIES: DUF2585 domain-containing protein [unclassified Sphingobium]GLI97223.1 UPF0314 protein [Sphingobium sp. BS19]